LKITTSYIDRELFYLTSEEDWQSQIPTDNWCLILISNSENQKVIDRIISASISNNVGYVCGIGTKHDYIHTETDSEYALRDIGESKFPRPKYHVLTVGDEDFDEGMWFGLNLTFNRDVEIHKILIIDTDCKGKEVIEKLIGKFEEGYLPDEK